MHKFEVLFDDGEVPGAEQPAAAAYGKLGFPAAPPDRPWIFSNFVQSLDGIVSFRGKHASGGAIARLQEDRWLMDLLRAHADAVLLGVNTLKEETALSAEGSRGPVFRIMDPALRGLRQQLRPRRERNIFVTGNASLDLSRYRVFDGDRVDTAIISTLEGVERLRKLTSHPHVRLIAAGHGVQVDLKLAMQVLHAEFGIEYLLCEGGPTLYGYMSRAGLMDEKFVTVAPLEIGQLVPPEQEPNVCEAQNPPTLRPTTFAAPGFTFETAPEWRWVSCRRVGEHQFSRYRRR